MDETLRDSRPPQVTGEVVLQSEHDNVPPNPFHVIIHQSSYHPTLHSLDTDSVVKQIKKRRHFGLTVCIVWIKEHIQISPDLRILSCGMCDHRRGLDW
jgi:hypothetical protein